MGCTFGLQPPQPNPHKPGTWLSISGTAQDLGLSDPLYSMLYPPIMAVLIGKNADELQSLGASTLFSDKPVCNV